jgi:quercetin dioxygenase-like cupin family protein
MTTLTEPEPRLLADLDWVLAQSASSASGALWRLEEADRQLDAKLIRLRPGQSVDLHQESDVDVMLLPLAGGGTLRCGDESDSEAISLAPHALIWLPRGSRRALEAGSEGLAYLTVHRKRAGMTIKLPTDPEKLRQLEAREEAAEGGEPACLLPRVCPECGRVMP